MNEQSISSSIIKRPILLACLLLLAAGCGGEGEHGEHHTAAHKPADFPAAVTRLRRLHEEVLNGPLVVREVEISSDHHDHNHSHGPSQDHDEDHDDDHVRLDALQEMSDVVGWLPALAADSDLEETPWNKTYEISLEITSILAGLPDSELSQRQQAYRKQASRIESQLAMLEEIGESLHHDGTDHDHR